MRTTRKMIDEQLAALNSLSGDKYELNIWRPGDGWTRFLLKEKSTGKDVSFVVNASEIYHVLYVALRVLAAR